MSDLNVNQINDEEKIAKSNKNLETQIQKNVREAIIEQYIHDNRLTPLDLQNLFEILDKNDGYCNIGLERIKDNICPCIDCIENIDKTGSCKAGHILKPRTSGFAQTEELNKDLANKVEVHDVGDNRPTSEDFLAIVDDFVKDPTQLKLNNEDSTIMQKTGFMDKDTADVLINTINFEIDEFIKDPELSHLADINERRKFVIDVLNIKQSLKDFDNTAKDANIKEAFDQAFNIIYRDYVEKGPFLLINNFNLYLHNRINTDKDRLYHEIYDFDVIKEVLENAKERIFKELHNFRLEYFISLIFNRNKALYCKLTDKKIEELAVKDVEPLLIIFSMLFLRFIYKKYTLKNNILNHRLFLDFLGDIAETSKLPENLVLLADKAFEESFKLIMVMIVECDQKNNLVNE